jgi:hypothetical protein
MTAALLSLSAVAPAGAGAAGVTDLTINPTGSFSASGAIVTGTATCDPEVNGMGAVVSLRQVSGGRTIEGYVDAELVCDGDAQPWGVLILGDHVDNQGNSLWQPGPATARIFIEDPLGGPGQSVERVITLERTWSHVGTGPLATSTGTSASVRYPAGIVSGDLLLLGCQGKNNAMNWSAPGFTTVPGPGSQPVGPAGLRFELLTSWAVGGESEPGRVLSVTSTTGLNGWSCSITAMRGGWGRGLVWYHGSPTANQPRRDMVAHDQVHLEGYLITHWFASSDDNNHGLTSHGVMAFGGSAYDTTIGTDHAASMSWHVGTQPECPQGCPPPAGAEPFVTMRQRSNGPDAYAAATFVFSPVELVP